MSVSDTRKKRDMAASPDDRAFLERREAARAEINALDRGRVHDAPERKAFFNDVYARAGGDAAFVPWADLKPKDQLVQWLVENPGIGSAETSSGIRSALDIACGLGDNAEAMAAMGRNDTSRIAGVRVPTTSAIDPSTAAMV